MNFIYKFSFFLRKSENLVSRLLDQWNFSGLASLGFELETKLVDFQVSIIMSG